MSGHAKSVLVVGGSGVEGYSEVVRAVNALLVSGTPQTGYVLVVGEDGNITYAPGGGGSTTAIVTVTELPAAGNATVVYRLRTAGGDLTGYYAWDEHTSAYTMLPTLDQVQDVVEDERPQVVTSLVGLTGSYVGQVVVRLAGDADDGRYWWDGSAWRIGGA